MVNHVCVGSDKKLLCVTQACEMVQSPQILTLLLKRFFFDGSTMSYLKSNRCVDVPRVIETEVGNNGWSNLGS